MEGSYADKVDIECALRRDEVIDSSVMAAWACAEDDAAVIEAEDCEDEEEVDDEEAAISHAVADPALRLLEAYVMRSNHGFPSDIMSKAQGLLSDIRKFRAKPKQTSQQVMTSFFTSA